jgi:hypothetical protein
MKYNFVAFTRNVLGLQFQGDGSKVWGYLLCLTMVNWGEHHDFPCFEVVLGILWIIVCAIDLVTYANVRLYRTKSRNLHTKIR